MTLKIKQTAFGPAFCNIKSSSKALGLISFLGFRTGQMSKIFMTGAPGGHWDCLNLVGSRLYVLKPLGFFQIEPI